MGGYVVGPSMSSCYICSGDAVVRLTYEAQGGRTCTETRCQTCADTVLNSDATTVIDEEPLSDEYDPGKSGVEDYSDLGKLRNSVL